MKAFRWMAAALLAVVMAAPAAAQTDQGRLSGTVRDQSGAFVAGATVSVKNERTGESRNATTDAQGFFVVDKLKPSTYTISAVKDGFQLIEYNAMTLAVGQELGLDFELRPAGVQEAVTVVGAAPVLDISSARIGANVSQREVEELPVNGRQMSQLMLQAPGSQNAGTGTWQEIRFSGRAVEQNAIRYDGIEGSAIIDAAPGNLNGEVPSPFKLQASLENVQEFRVESSNYPAEYGTGTGGQVSVITKSGGNLFNGSLFEYYRNDGLDAPNYFDSTRNNDGSVKEELPKSKLDQNQFGFSIGGPIVTNKAFFFGSYEGYRLNAGTNSIEAVPSDAAWAQAVPAIAALRPGFLAPGAIILPGASPNPLLRHRAAAGGAAGTRTLAQRAGGLSLQRQLVVLRPRVPRPGHERPARRRERPQRPYHRQSDERGGQPPGHSRERRHQRVQVRLQLGADPDHRRSAGRQRHRLRAARHQPERLDREQRHPGAGRHLGHRRPGRPRTRQQRHQRARVALQALLADVRRLLQPRRRQPSGQSRRRSAGHPHGDRPDRRHDLQLQQHRQLPDQQPVERAVRGQPERPERVQRRGPRVRGTPCRTTTWRTRRTSGGLARTSR